MRDPDGVQDSLQDAVAREVGNLEDVEGLNAVERQAIMDIRYAEMATVVDNFIEGRSHVTIIIDTESDTATVERQ